MSAREERCARIATNPTPNETGKLLDFHWNWLNDRPILWTVAIVITLVGAVYFILVQRTKPAHLQAPEGANRRQPDRATHGSSRFEPFG